MKKRIAIIQGHPDPAGGHLCHALADAYAEGARAAGHEVAMIDVAHLDFPLLRTREDWLADSTPDGLKSAQQQILDAEHMVILYPLWLGTLPALLKGFLEQVLRPSLASSTPGVEPPYSEFAKLLKGTSCRIVITMGMPALAYRFFFFSHSLKNLQRNILKFVGVGPIRSSLFGMVESVSSSKRSGWIEDMRRFGKDAI